MTDKPKSERFYAVFRNRDGKELHRMGPYDNRETAEMVVREKQRGWGSVPTVESVPSTGKEVGP
jgi:hypothetical protein